MLMYLNVIIMDSKLKNPPLLQQYYVYDVCYDIAMFTKVNMGLFQVQAMAELLIRLSKKETEEKAKLVFYLRATTFSANLIVTITMIVEAFFFVKVMNGFYESCPAPWNTPDCYLTGFVKYMK